MGKDGSRVVFPSGQSCSEGKPISAPRSLPKLLQGEKQVDDPIDGTYQGQSNSVATTTCAKGNERVTARYQGLCDGYGGGRIERVTLDLKELRS